MPLIKLNRINKGGEIYINSDHILYMEVESRTTTLHLTHNLLFSVEEPLDTIAKQVEQKTADNLSTGIKESGICGIKP